MFSTLECPRRGNAGKSTANNIQQRKDFARRGYPAPIYVRALRRGLDVVARGTTSWHSLFDGCEVREIHFGKANGIEIMAPGARQDRTILYFHGGAHVVFSAWTHREIAGRLSVATRSRVIAVNYRLAPENPFPAALEDALDAWRWACERHPPGSVAVAGDSAGGNLAFSLLVKLAQLGEEQPAACLGMAPWLLLDPEQLAQRRRDNPNLPEGMWEMLKVFSRDENHKSTWVEGAEECSERYCQGHSPSDPLVSPLLANQEILQQFPPILLHLTDKEPLVPDAREMALKCQKAGVPVELKEYPGRIHVFQAWPKLFEEEARDSFARMSSFLETHWRHSDSTTHF